MKSIGIKLADGSFYPLLEEGNPEKKSIDLTTATDGQTKVHVDVYRSDTGTMEGAEYLDTLEMQDLKPHQTGEPTLDLSLDMDESGELQAQITDSETGAKSGIQVTLASKVAALPARDANATPFDFDELEGLTQPDDAPLTPSAEDTAQPSAQEPVADDAAESAPLTQKSKADADTPRSESPTQQEAADFDMSALDELADEPFDFEPSDNAQPSVVQSATDDTPAVPEEAQAAADASATQVPLADEAVGRESGEQTGDVPLVEDADVGAPDVDEEEIKSLEELDLDELGGTTEESPELVAEGSGGTQDAGKGLLNAAEAKRENLDDMDLGSTGGDSPDVAEPAEDVGADEFDLGGLEQLGDLGVQDKPGESDDQIMVPDPASLVPEIEDMGESAPIQEIPSETDVPTGEETTAQEATSVQEAQPADELPSDEGGTVEEIPDVTSAGEDSLDEADLDNVVAEPAEDVGADEFDLGGLEQLGDLVVQDKPGESDDQIMIPDPASLVPEIEDISDTVPAQDVAASESGQPTEKEEAVDRSDEAQEQLSPAEELAAPEEEEPTAELAAEETEPAADVSADTAEFTAEEELPVIDEASIDEAQPVDEPSPEEPTVTQETEPKDELAPTETLPPLDEASGEEAEPVEQIPEAATTDEGSLDDVDLGSAGEESPLAAEPTEDVGADDFGLSDLDGIAREEAAEPVEEVAAQETEEIPVAESDAPQISEEVQEDTLPAQEDDTDLGQLNDEPFDFDTGEASEDSAQESPAQDNPPQDVLPATEVDDADDFGLGELAAMDLGSLAELPDATEDGFSAQEAAYASEEEPPTPDVTAEVESPDDFQLPSLDDEGETGDVSNGEVADFDLPDFDDSSTAQGDTAEDFTLPDFDDDLGGDNLDFSGLFDENPDSTEDKPNDDLIFSDEDFSLPDDFLSDTQEDSKTDIGGSAGLFNGLDKEGLYDKATLEGGSPSYSEDDDVKRKTKAPVVICVICAIICVLAAALMLLAELKPDVLRSTFFSKSESSKMISLIESVKSESQTQQETATDQSTQGEQGTQTKPAGDAVQKGAGELSSSSPPPKAESTAESKTGSQSKDASSATSTNTANTATSAVQSAQGQGQTQGSTQGQEVSPPAVEAREDQIVVASSPEMVTPRAPEPNPQKAADVRYKVVWGDTLWDISNAYYRTPWKFRRIANYNGIKDPDKIIAGTWLLLPAE